jgi:hypothetical protein
VVLSRVVIIWEYGDQHVMGDAVRSLVVPDVSRTRFTRWYPDGEAAVFVQDHAPAVFQHDEFAHGEALGACVVEALRFEIADGANAHDGTWLDWEERRVIVSGIRVRAPTTFHTTHLSFPRS